MKGITFERINKNYFCCDSKILSLDKYKMVAISIENAFAPASIPCVKVGQKVAKGEIIAKANGKSGINIYSSVSGSIHSIESMQTTSSNVEKHIVIYADEENRVETFKPVKSINSENIKKAIHNAGVVDFADKYAPLHLKLNENCKIKQILIAGVENEPYFSANRALLVEKTSEIIEGAKYIAKFYKKKEIVFAVDKNDEFVFEIVERKSHANSFIKLYENVKKYPFGNARLLVKSIFDERIEANESLFEKGYLVLDAATCFAIYEAVKLGKPYYEKVVSVLGGAIVNPQNMLVPNGALIFNLCLAAGSLKFDNNRIKEYEELSGEVFAALDEDKVELTKQKQKLKNLSKEKIKAERLLYNQALKAYKIKKKQSYKKLKKIGKKIEEDFDNVLAQIIVGGAMSGESIKDLYVSIGNSQSVPFLSRNEIDFDETGSCINCGKCSKVCPVNLFPNKIEQAFLMKNFKLCSVFQMERCIECGCCSYVCPAKREIMENVKFAKQICKGGDNE